MAVEGRTLLPFGWSRVVEPTFRNRAGEIGVPCAMRTQLVPALWSIGAAAVWVVLASRNPELTYHFAPLIAAGAWPIAGSRPWAAIGSGAIALAAASALQLAGSLEGPDLVGGEAAFAEAILFALIGAGAGWARAVSRSPRTTSSG